MEDASQLETQAGQDSGGNSDGEQDAPQAANGAQKPPPGQQAPADEADPDPEVTRVSDTLLSSCLVTVAQYVLSASASALARRRWEEDNPSNSCSDS